MVSACRAAIDVGTNSVKLLVAEVAGSDVRPVLEKSKQTRLGQGFYETRRLRPEAIRITADAVLKFAETARGLGAQSIRVIATSAARDAVNPGELTAAIEGLSGLKAAILSGEQEADWAYRGVTSDPALAASALLLLDVGGGSTQFILGWGGRAHFRHSFALGTVRMLEGNPHRDPPGPQEFTACRRRITEFLQVEVRPRIEPALRREAGRVAAAAPEIQLVGTGGTASILARIEAKLEDFDRGRIEATRLRLDRLQALGERLWSLPLAERKKIVGLPRKRADVILPGVAIFETVMGEFGFDALRVSTRGLRFAAVMDDA